MTSEAIIKLPPKLVPVFASERGSVQYRAARGGRGSGKTTVLVRQDGRDLGLCRASARAVYP